MSYVIIALAIIIGSAIVGATFAYFIRARRDETGGGLRPDFGSAAVPSLVAKELETIGEKIDLAMADQRFQGETQRQLIAQKLETVRTSVEAQKNHVHGLRSEFLHESRRRDEEIAAIRTQIGAIQRSVGLPVSTPQAALPPALPLPLAEAADDDGLTFPLPDPAAEPEAIASPAAPPVSAAPQAIETPFEDIVFAESSAAEAPTPDEPAVQDLSFEETTFSEETFVQAAVPSTPAAQELEVMGPPAPEPSTFDTFEETTFAAPTPDRDTPAAPSADETFADETFAEETFVQPQALPSPVPAKAASVPDEVALEESFAETFADAPPTADPGEFHMSSPPAPSAPEASVPPPSPQPVAEEPPAATAPPLDDDPFATASLYDEYDGPIGGDSAADLGDVFETWQPHATTPSHPTAQGPSPETESVALDARPSFDTQGSAWISRRQTSPEPAAPEPSAALPADLEFVDPDLANLDASGYDVSDHDVADHDAFGDSLDLQQASADEFFDIPMPSPARVAREEHLIDLDALMAAPDVEAPEPTAEAPAEAVSALPADVQPLRMAAPPPSVAPEPVVEAAPEPVVEAAPEPVVEAAPEPFSMAAPEPSVEAAPAVEPASEFIFEAAHQPLPETTFEPIVEAAPQPVVVAAPEPVVEAAPEPVVEVAPEPVAEAAPEPFAPDAPEPSVEPASEFVFEAAPPPVVEAASQPVVEGTEAPVAATAPVDVPALVLESDPTLDLTEDAGDPVGAIEEDAPHVSTEPEEPAFEVPEGAEDLTVIATIDGDVQQLLYRAGVRSLEEIAQWGRGEARRISNQVDVSEDTIMNQWVFEAQAALFNRYSQQAGS